MREVNFSGISGYHSRLGRLIRLPLRAIPNKTVLPILQGPLKGTKWIAGSSNHGCWLGSYEFEKQRRFFEAVPQGGVVWDLGAHVGFYTLLAAKKAKYVLAIEPLAENAAYLDEHLRLNHILNVNVLKWAVCDTSGTGRFSPGHSTSMGKIAASGVVEVRLFTLNTLVNCYPPPALLKIDVEGAEFKVLRGGLEYLKASKPTIFLATHGCAVHKASVKLLQGIGYRLETLGAHDELIAAA